MYKKSATVLVLATRIEALYAKKKEEHSDFKFSRIRFSGAILTVHFDDQWSDFRRVIHRKIFVPVDFLRVIQSFTVLVYHLTNDTRFIIVLAAKRTTGIRFTHINMILE